MRCRSRVRRRPGLPNKLHLSVGGISILLALSLAAWEYYFFWYGGTNALGSLDSIFSLMSRLIWLVVFLALVLTVLAAAVAFGLLK